MEYVLEERIGNPDLFTGRKEEAVEFEKKLAEVKKLENIDLAVGFIFSRCGFTKEAEDYCKEKGIACSEDKRWLGD